MAQIKYPIGIQNFSDLRLGEYVYIDKTKYIYDLIDNGKYYFLSRPRRFGKSLLLSTIEAYFKGRKELFNGLDISRIEKKWIVYPVFHLALNAQQYNSADDLRDVLMSFIEGLEREYGSDEKSDSVSLRFAGVIRKAAETTGCKVVILIDEYDKPLLDTTGNERLQDELRDMLKAFYGNLKAQDQYIRFGMLTGVTKFGKLSIFSDLNNLTDISLSPEYDSICGITENELRSSFTEGIARFAIKQNMSGDDILKRLKLNYDGYHFSTDLNDIYNPFSVMLALRFCSIDDYWFESGTPTFLIKMIKEDRIALSDLDSLEVDLQSLGSVSFSLGDPIPVLYQSGYLTIKGYDREFNMATVGYPNKEVQSGFLKQLLSYYTSLRNSATAFTIQQFVKDVRAGKVDDFMTRLQSIFSDYQYDAIDLGNLELHYQDVIYLVMKLMGYHTHTEYRTSSGRIDLLVETNEIIYIFEFKINSTALVALQQINDRNYAAPFKSSGKRIIKIGANFDNSIRSIDS